ncbi:MAG: Mrp/NBP35 family ATP-binding protein [Deltaproteobacteria bacterium]|nr:MAG: Mrp/NBP35 family ATP-binding protein [Deltaproteobacteria bacterium]
MSYFFLVDYFSQITVPEFKQNLMNLGWIKLIKKKQSFLLVQIDVPTFALNSLQFLKKSIWKHLFKCLKATPILVRIHITSNLSFLSTNNVNTGIKNVKNIILVVSGKGGVGKSTVAANLSLSLLNKGCKVGLLDADVYGPSIPTLFNLTSKISIFAQQENSNVSLEPIIRNGLKMMSIGFLVDTSTAMIWRGPVISSACLQLFHNVQWGDLDYLIVDMPPGTGDIHLTIAQKISVSGAVLISTPHNLAIADVIRIKSLLRKTNIDIFGYVENMSYFICQKCSAKHYIFNSSEKNNYLLNIPRIIDIPIHNNLNFLHSSFEYLSSFIGLATYKSQKSNTRNISILD